MKIKKRISMAAVVMLLAFMLWYAMEASMPESEITTEQTEEQTTLNVWYSDESMQAYIEGAAKSYEEKNNIEVNTKLISEIEYIEMINDSSVGEEFEGPDV